MAKTKQKDLVVEDALEVNNDVEAEEVNNDVEAEKESEIKEKESVEVTKQPNPGERYAPKEYGKEVTIKIPKNELNPNDDVIPVRINQYKWNIKRGVEVKVPEAVKEVLENANYI